MGDEAVRAIAAVVVPIGAVVVWLLRLEGRVNTHQALHEALRDDVAYIRDRIDRALNGRE